MSNEDEFVQADVEAGEVTVESPDRGTTAISTAKPRNLMPADVVEFRKQLIEEYHKGASGLVARIKQAGKTDAESLVVGLIDEIVTETDHLLGNELVATHNGELRDASIISFKRAEVLEKALEAVQAKQKFERTSGISVDSPAMNTIFRYFMLKAKDTFDRMGVGDEVRDLFFRQLPEVMSEWKKELRDSLEELENKR